MCENVEAKTTFQLMKIDKNNEIIKIKTML
jgi:hypothetical protein